jgi:hypothetical protein
MWENVKYVKSPIDDGQCINADKNGWNFCIPVDPTNRVYQEIMQLVAEGKLTIQPAEGAQQ